MYLYLNGIKYIEFQIQDKKNKKLLGLKFTVVAERSISAVKRL